MDYLELFPGATREKQRFMTLAGAVLGQVTDLMDVVAEINGAFAPAEAEGVQLDALGAGLGLSRGSRTDEEYLDLIQKKLMVWRWDGTNGTVPEVLEKIQPGANQMDNQDGTVTVTGAGELPGTVKELFPIPAGINSEQ